MKAVWTHVQHLGLVRTFQLHQAADGVFFLAVESRFSCVPHDGGKSPTQSSAVDIIFQRQWMENPVFPVLFWSVYQFVVWTKQWCIPRRYLSNFQWNLMIFGFFYCIWASLTICILLTQAGKIAWTRRHAAYPFPCTSWSPSSSGNLSWSSPELLPLT